MGGRLGEGELAVKKSEHRLRFTLHFCYHIHKWQKLVNFSKIWGMGQKLFPVTKFVYPSMTLHYVVVSCRGGFWVKKKKFSCHPQKELLLCPQPIAKLLLLVKEKEHEQFQTCFVPEPHPEIWPKAVLGDADNQSSFQVFNINSVIKFKKGPVLPRYAVVCALICQNIKAEAYLLLSEQSQNPPCLFFLLSLQIKEVQTLK